MSDTAAAELLQHTDPALLSALRALGDQHGPLGVALTAAALTEPEALVARLRTAGLLDADGVTLIAAQVRAETLREAANAWTQGAWADAPRRSDRAVERIATAQYVGDWLRARASAPTEEAGRG